MDIMPDPYAERLEDEVNRLRALNNELLDTLKSYVEDDEFNDALTNKARSLIAKVEGK